MIRVARRKQAKRVRIVCDECGSDQGTETIVEGLAKAHDTTGEQVHADLWDDCGRTVSRRLIVLEGGHAERIVAS